MKGLSQAREEGSLMGKKYTSPEPLTLAHVGGDFMALAEPRGLKASVFETHAPWLGTDGGFRRIGGHGGTRTGRELRLDPETADLCSTVCPGAN